MSILVSPRELNSDVTCGGGFAIVAALAGRQGGYGWNLFLKEHIPTARFCDPRSALSSTPSAERGRNPMPSVSQLHHWTTTAGLRQDQEIICYGNAHVLYAARLWWMLRWAGVTNVRILDGNLTAWLEAGYPVLGGPGNLNSAGNIQVQPGNMPLATIEDVRHHDGILIDAREAQRFAGSRETVDRKAGHIPGAVNVPTEAVLRPNGTFKAPAIIRERFTSLGVTDPRKVIVYSGSGTHSAVVLAAMEIAGLSGAAHYVGGWSQWSADVHNPVESEM